MNPLAFGECEPCSECGLKYPHAFDVCAQRVLTLRIVELTQAVDKLAKMAVVPPLPRAKKRGRK